MPSRRYAPPELVPFGNQRENLGSGGWMSCSTGTQYNSNNCTSGGHNKKGCSNGCTAAYKALGCTNGYEAQTPCTTGSGVAGSTCTDVACCSGTTAVKTGSCINGTYASSCATGGCPVACYSTYCSYS